MQCLVRLEVLWNNFIFWFMDRLPAEWVNLEWIPLVHSIPFFDFQFSTPFSQTQKVTWFKLSAHNWIIYLYNVVLDNRVNSYCPTFRTLSHWVIYSFWSKGIFWLPSKLQSTSLLHNTRCHTRRFAPFLLCLTGYRLFIFHSWNV